MPNLAVNNLQIHAHFPSPLSRRSSSSTSECVPLPSLGAKAMSRPLWRPQRVRRIASPRLPGRLVGSAAPRAGTRTGLVSDGGKRALLDPAAKAAAGAQLAGAWVSPAFVLPGTYTYPGPRLLGTIVGRPMLSS